MPAGSSISVPSVHIVSPTNQSEVYSCHLRLYGEVVLESTAGSENLLVCWVLTSRLVKERVESCFPILPAETWNGVHVALPNRGLFDLKLKLLQRLDNGARETIAETATWFLFGIDPSCEALLHERSFVQPHKYMASGFAGNEDEVGLVNYLCTPLKRSQIMSSSSFLQGDAFVDFEFTPLCYDSDRDHPGVLPSALQVTSASRGFFGVDHTVQQVVSKTLLQKKQFAGAWSCTSGK
jgi:hypothetical protein